jgi:hypothetical protein
MYQIREVSIVTHEKSCGRCSKYMITDYYFKIIFLMTPTEHTTDLLTIDANKNSKLK